MVKNNKSSLSSFFLAKWLWCIFSQSFGHWTNNTIHQKSEWTSSIPNYGRRGKMVAWMLQQLYPQDEMIVPPLKGLNKCISMIAPGLAPWAMQEYRPLGAHYPTAPTIPPNNPPPQPIQSQSNKYKNTNERNNPFTHPKTFNEHNTTTQLRKRPIRQRALKGRHSCIAQGEIRAKPDMEPWVNADKSRLSSVGAALTHTSKCPKG